MATPGGSPGVRVSAVRSGRGYGTATPPAPPPMKVPAPLVTPVWLNSSSDWMMIRGVTMIMMCRVSRPIPWLRNSRFRYGIWLSTGGPNSFRPSARVFSPPSTTVPPSGTATVVWTLMVETDGCWKNWVNGIGTPCDPPSNTGVMNAVTGDSGTVADVRAVRVGARFIRTNRRSADTIAWTVTVTPGPDVTPGGAVWLPIGIGVLVGR